MNFLVLLYAYSGENSIFNCSKGCMWASRNISVTMLYINRFSKIAESFKFDQNLKLWKERKNVEFSNTRVLKRMIDCLSCTADYGDIHMYMWNILQCQ